MTDFWKHTEGRRLEFKGEIPSHSDLAKTVVAFANDAGGDIYIGIDNKHNIVGLPEEILTTLEEQLSNMVYDRCFQVQFVKKNYFSDNVGDDVGDDVGDRNTKESQILSMISKDSGISATVMADRLGITKRHCERIIAKMKSDGLISREGSAKNGKWIITKTDK